MEGKEPEHLQIDCNEYLYHIGDNLTTWISYICLDLEETDIVRLSILKNIIDKWEEGQFFIRDFCDLLRLFVLPQLDIAKQKNVANQILSGNPNPIPYETYENDSFLQETLQDQLLLINKYPITRKAV